MTQKLFVVTLILLSAAAVSVLYHYDVRIPADTRSEQELRRQQAILESSRRCREDGTRFISEFMREWSDPAIRRVWDEPEFHFSRKLNTCLVHIRWIQEYGTGTLSYHYNRVMDIYANRTLLYSEFKRDLSFEPPKESVLDTTQADVPNYTSARYSQEKRKLFAE